MKRLATELAFCLFPLGGGLFVSLLSYPRLRFLCTMYLHGWRAPNSHPAGVPGWRLRPRPS